MSKKSIILNLLKVFLIQIVLVAFASNDEYKSQQSNKIYRFEGDENGVHTSSWNKTYVFSGGLISNKKITNIYLEMEVETPLNNKNQIFFGLKKDRAPYYNTTQDSFFAEYIDTRGYYMRKQHYLLEIQQDQQINDSDQYYITIFQNTPEPQELKYSLKMIIINHDNNSTQQKHCPFNCLNRGQCNRSEGSCMCDNEFVDYDCSKPSTSLSQFSSEINKQGIFEWDLNFKNSNNGKFYHILDRDFDGYLYLQIYLDDEFFSHQDNKINVNQLNNNDQQDKKNFSESLEIYYTLDNKNLKGIGVADRKFAKSFEILKVQELYENQNGIEIFLDEFQTNDQKESLNIEVKEIQQMILLGFRLEENNNDVSGQNLNFKMKLVLKSEPTHLNNNDSPLDTFIAFTKHNQTIVILFVILFILICVLIGLLLFVRKHSILISQTEQQRQQQILNKKMKKEEEFKKIFDLIASFTYNELNKQKYWPNLKNSCQQQDDGSEQPTCSICLCEFSEGEDVRVTYCPHFFHEDCLKEWIKKQKNCPHCRNELIFDQSKTRKKSSRSSPSQILKNIIQSITNTPDQNKKQKNGYDQQIDDIIIHLEPLESATVNKQEQQEQKIIQTQQEQQNIEIIKLDSNTKVMTKLPPRKLKSQLITQNSFKQGSYSELDQSGDHIKNTEQCFSLKTEKSFKRRSLQTQLSKFSDPQPQNENMAESANLD